MSNAHIFLYGPPGSGKSTVGRALAHALDLSFLDLDVEIEKWYKRTIPQIFSDEGEVVFREMEKQGIEQLLTQEGAVIALGGGSLINPSVREFVQTHGNVLCLHATLEVLLNRLSEDFRNNHSNTQRPLLAGNIGSRLVDLLSQRADHYATFPIQLDTTYLDVEPAAWQAQIMLGRFRVSNVNQPYDVCIHAGGLDSIGDMIAQRGFQGSFVLVADSNSGPLYAARVVSSLQRLGISSRVITIPAGENSKSMEFIQKLWGEFLDEGLDRGSTVLALGGGVVGDVTGFAASTYMRGIRWVNVPTTLVAMADACLGGKTGVNITRGKNLVGTFHPPAFVLADPNVLITLPEGEFRSGMVEVIKHGLIADPGLFEKCLVFKPSNLSTCGSELVSRAMAVKVKIIEEDPYEKGIRAALNLGHTIGHAIELVSGYRLRHGEAVAIGLVVEARLAERLGLAEPGLSLHITSVLSRMDLPVEIPKDLDRAAVRRAIGVDKKKVQGRVRFALPIRIGQVQIGVDVPDEVLAAEI